MCLITSNVFIDEGLTKREVEAGLSLIRAVNA